MHQPASWRTVADVDPLSSWGISRGRTVEVLDATTGRTACRRTTVAPGRGVTAADSARLCAGGNSTMGQWASVGAGDETDPAAFRVQAR